MKYIQLTFITLSIFISSLAFASHTHLYMRLENNTPNKVITIQDGTIINGSYWLKAKVARSGIKIDANNSRDFGVSKYYTHTPRNHRHFGKFAVKFSICDEDGSHCKLCESTLGASVHSRGSYITSQVDFYPKNCATADHYCSILSYNNGDPVHKARCAIMVK